MTMAMDLDRAERKPPPTLRPYQAECLQKLIDYRRTSTAELPNGGRRAVVVLPTGCHQQGQRLLLYDGTFKRVEDVQVGDQLMGPDSTPRYVLGLARGVDDMVAVVPKKGEPWVVNKNHILSVVQTSTSRDGLYPSERHGGAIEDVVLDALSRASRWKRHISKLFAPTIVRFQTTEWPTPLDPYFLGLLLGDGSLATDHTVSITSVDDEVLEECARQAIAHGLFLHRDRITYRFTSGVRKQSNPILDKMRGLGLLPIACEDRFIPHRYKVGSIEERRQILAGLLDTDGAYHGGGYDYVSKSAHLAAGVAFLCRSLGLSAWHSEKMVGGTFYHRISISGDCTSLPLRIPRKRSTAPREQIKSVLRRGFYLEPTGRREEYFGFVLDGDHRYLLDDFTVTHNCGKTVIFSRLPKYARGKVLVLAHREELIDQAARKIREANPDIPVGVEQADRYSTPYDKVVVASVPTFAANPPRLKKFRREDVSVIITDEVHHALATSYIKIYAHFGLAPDITRLNGMDIEKRRDEGTLGEIFSSFQPPADAPFSVGFTATPERSDGRGLEWLFDDVVFSRTMAEMMDAGYLCPVRGVQVQSGTDISKVKTRAGDFAESDLAKTVNTDERNELVVDAYLEHAKDRQCIVFCTDREHTRAVWGRFYARGISAAVVLGDTDTEERRTAIRQYQEGKVRVLVNCMVLTEGFDAPETSAIILARPTKSSLVLTQCIGRGTRLAPGKADLLVIDIVDICSKAGVQTLNTLFGLPPRLSLTSDDVRQAKRKLEQMELQLPPDLLAESKSFEDVARAMKEFNPLISPKVEPEIANASSLAWMRTGYGFVLTFPRSHGVEVGVSEAAKAGSLGVITDMLGHATLKLKTEGSPRPVELGTYATASDAVRAGDLWLRTYRGDRAGMLDRNSRWRKDPPTDSQIRMMRRLKIPHTDGMTKGDASVKISQALERKGGEA